MQAILWSEIAALCLLALAPAMRAAAGVGRAGSRDRRGPAIAQYRARLRELDREQDEGLIAAAEHRAARLEVERRLLAADAEPDAAVRTGGAGAVRAGLLAAPALGVLLYLAGGHPDLPGQPMASRAARAADRERADGALIETLRQGLTRLDPSTAGARRGYLLLGQAEASRGNWQGAATAWQVALAHGFDPTLAVQVAEAQSRADGGVSPASAALFRRALDSAPADAPWRQLAEQRLAQSEHR